MSHLRVLIGRIFPCSALLLRHISVSSLHHRVGDDAAEDRHTDLNQRIERARLLNNDPTADIAIHAIGFHLFHIAIEFVVGDLVVDAI